LLGLLGAVVRNWACSGRSSGRSAEPDQPQDQAHQHDRFGADRPLENAQAVMMVSVSASAVAAARALPSSAPALFKAS
jgi:hypothetical protein